MLLRIIAGCEPAAAFALETAAKRYPTVGVRLSAPTKEKKINVSVSNDEIGLMDALYRSDAFRNYMVKNEGIWRRAAEERWEGIYDPIKPARVKKEKAATESTDKPAKQARLPKLVIPPAVKPEPVPSSLPAMREAIDSLRNLPLGQLSDRELSNKISRLRREIKQNAKLIPLLMRAEQEQARRKAALREPSRYAKAAERRDRVGSFAVPSTTGNIKMFKANKSK